MHIALANSVMQDQGGGVNGACHHTDSLTPYLCTYFRYI